ncbi:hypothetical protein GCM10023160_33990 [Brachybacterium paraconglomeratum]
MSDTPDYLTDEDAQLAASIERFQAQMRDFATRHPDVVLADSPDADWSGSHVRAPHASDLVRLRRFTLKPGTPYASPQVRMRRFTLKPGTPYASPQVRMR